MAFVSQLHGIEHQLAIGSGKDIAHGLDIQHPLAYKAGLGRLVAGAAIGDDGHPVGVCQVLTDYQVAVYVQNVGVSQAQAHQLLVGDGLRGVDKLFHFHMESLLFKIEDYSFTSGPDPGRNRPWKRPRRPGFRWSVCRSSWPGRIWKQTGG